MAQTNSASLEITLVGDCDIKITREFNARRELVFEAFTSCQHISKWLGPRDMTMSDCEMDFQTGGHYRYGHRDPDGTNWMFFGEFLEIDPPGRIVQTFAWEGMPGEVAIDTMTLEDRNGNTFLTVISQYASREARDAMAQSGMEEGVRDSYDRLEEHVVSIGEE